MRQTGSPPIELLAQDEGLGQAFGRGLDLVADGKAQLLARAEDLLEARQILGGGDDQDSPGCRRA